MFLRQDHEEDKSEPGTYDFLCIDESSENSDLAVEITTFMESSCRKAFDRAIGEIASKLVAKLSGRLPGEFELQIPGPARKDTVALNESDNLFISSEKVRYGYIGKKKVKFVDDLANRIEEIAQEPYFLVGEQHMIHQPIVCDLIKRSNNGNLLTVLYDYFDPSPSMPRNMAADGFQIYMSRSTKRILEKKNRQLQAPKSLNKTTALILRVDLEDPLVTIYGTLVNLRQVIESQSRETWSNIDWIFMRRGNSLHLIKKR